VRFQKPTLPSVGSFQKKKHPVSQRLFTFGDGTMLRVHFAPTDDGEHRSVLPMIHSANKGDTLRISMFGNSGYEYIRALQLAEARGVTVRIVVDGQQGAGKFSWLNDVSGNLLESPNPYEATLHRKFPELAFPRDQAGRIFRRLEVRSSGFDGKNHYKAGSLTRAPKGPNQPGIVETFIVGSQNWSTGGNDANDENMISIQNKRVGLKIGRQFNLEFEHLWQASRRREFKSPLVAQQGVPRR
jgi:phosphatidylserine/phosphatidylglycerophosphate/cardiolipin synthase-like enzyme